MCKYEAMSAIGNYSFLASIVVVVVAGILLALVAMVARDRRHLGKTLVYRGGELDVVPRAARRASSGDSAAFA